MENFRKLEKNTNYTYHRWIWWAYSYLSLAEIGLKRLKKETKNPTQRIHIKEYFSFRKRYLLIPIIYNLKHAIEIIIKALKIQVEKKYIATHDSIVNKEALQASIKSSGFKINQKRINELVEIIEKYYKLEFWDKRFVLEGTVYDRQNDIFRFPDNSASFSIDSESLTKFSKKEMKELFDELSRDLDSLFVLLSAIKSDIQTSRKGARKLANSTT